MSRVVWWCVAQGAALVFVEVHVHTMHTPWALGPASLYL
jgi:hypothetical protein